LTAWLELADLATDASFQELSRRSATWLHEAADGPIDVPASWPTPRGSSFRCSQPTPTSRSPLLDTWVASHATTLRRDDDAAFRSWLLARYDELTDPRFERFWTLVGHLNGGPPAPDGGEHRRAIARLRDALRSTVTDVSPDGAWNPSRRASAVLPQLRSLGGGCDVDRPRAARGAGEAPGEAATVRADLAFDERFVGLGSVVLVGSAALGLMVWRYRADGRLSSPRRGRDRVGVHAARRARTGSGRC
jgi:hypothetical protein